MDKLDIRRFNSPDETRRFEHGSFELVKLGGMTVGRATYEPGWRWSEHVGGGPVLWSGLLSVKMYPFIVTGWLRPQAPAYLASMNGTPSGHL